MTSEKRALVLTLMVGLAVIVFATVLGLMKTGNPSRYFGEGRFTTGVSCFQLLLAGIFSICIFRVRREKSPEQDWRAGYWLWVLVAAGFGFLVADEALQIHEQMDKVINKVLHLPKSGWADRIDDVIIGFYGLIGIWVLWIFRREMSDFRIMLRPLILGFAFGFVSMSCDMLANRPDVFFWLTGDMALSKKLEGWFDVGDGALTLLAEGMFALAFFYGWRHARGRIEITGLGSAPRDRAALRGG